MTEDAERVALVGGRVVPVAGPPIAEGTVLFSAGRIVAVADATTPLPDGVRRVDVSGRWVLPGLIDAHTHLGILEDGVGQAGADMNEPTVPNGARFRAADGVNPADPAFRDAITGGVLAAGISTGSASPIGGQAVAVRCAGRTIDEMVLRDPCGLNSALGEDPKATYGEQDRVPATRMGTATVIREALTRARSQRDGLVRETPDVAEDLNAAALARVLSGEIPWRQHAHRADDIMTAIRLADEFGYNLVIDRGTEADLVAMPLAQKQIPVVLGPLVNSRRKLETSGRSLRTAGRLAAAGVRIAFTTEHYTNPVHFLAHQAAFAVREGLNHSTALEALTINPAEILGIDDRLGTLEPGKDADICIWTGDPLDVAQRVETAYIQGQPIYHYDHQRHTGMFGREEWRL